jgi:hypothetical protein
MMVGINKCGVKESGGSMRELETAGVEARRKLRLTEMATKSG